MPLLVIIDLTAGDDVEDSQTRLIVPLAYQLEILMAL
jgi:hypothetical protein